MNLETTPQKNKNEVIIAEDDFSFDEFDFKPITSGLGFHQPAATEVKPVFTERTMPMSAPVKTHPASTPVNKEMNVYQNDLSIFYGQSTPVAEAPQFKEEPVEVILKAASKGQRTFAYLMDLLFVGSVTALVLTVMARSISMNLLDVWQSYPHEITPLVFTLFAGFYLIYFAVFEKSSSSTLGKSLLGLQVVTMDNQSPGLLKLVLRSFVTLVNFVSLGLFAYFDLQSKVTQTKIVRIK